MSFDIINVFPSIDNKMGINSVKNFLDGRACTDLVKLLRHLNCVFKL